MAQSRGGNLQQGLKAAITLIGKGESMAAWEPDPDLDCDYGAISSAIVLDGFMKDSGVGFTWRHWFTVDKPAFYPRRFTDSRVMKHVPSTVTPWKSHPDVTMWEYRHELGPSFDVTGPIVQGPFGHNHSLLFAVQVCARLGYPKVYFAGCDLLSMELRMVADVLANWYIRAQFCSIEWFNCSSVSALAEYLPNAERMYV